MAKRSHRKPPVPSVPAREFDNPNYSRAHHGDKTNPPKIVAAINPYESAIVMLAWRGVIDGAQEKAADRIRYLYEALGGSGAGALDYSREPVDGGGARDPISLRLVSAGSEMKDLMDKLREEHGEYACKLVLYIAGEGRSIHDLTETRRQRDTMTDNLRTYLSFLACYLGYTNSAQPSQFVSENELTRARGNAR